MKPTALTLDDNHYPARLRERMGERTPSQVTALGNLTFLDQPKTALFCSIHCPGSVVLAAYDQAACWREENRCVISGFHSPIEKECLRILLRGKQPIIVCPVRSIKTLRTPPEWRPALAEGRLLILSPFSERHRRPTADHRPVMDGGPWRSFGGLRDPVGDAVADGAQAIVAQVRVALRHRAGAVAEELLHLVEGRPVLDRDRRERMAKVM